MTNIKNEVTITINLSDSLLNTFANLLILANAPAPQVLGLPPGVAVAKPPQNKAPIGFKSQVKK